MPPTIVRSQVRIFTKTGRPEDVVTNTWHFQTPGAPSQADLDLIRTRLVEFYTVAPTGGSALQTWMPAQVDNTANIHKIVHYDLAHDKPRVPLREDSFSLVPSATGSLPQEICVALSYRATYVSGVRRGSSRGRLYFGPLHTGAVGVSGERVVVQASLRAHLVGAAGRLRAYNDPLSLVWVVYSPTRRAQGNTPIGASLPVVAGWCDDAVDIQRRRGGAPALRHTF